MATVTPNYSWPVPTSGDLVKDGATAIEALGDAIDATVFAQAPGLVLLDTTSFSAVSSVSVSNKFTTTYTNYLIQFQSTCSASGQAVNFRLRDNVTDDSTSNYYCSAMGVSSSVASVAFANNDPSTSWRIATSGTDQLGINLHLYNPQVSGYTSFTNNAGAMAGTNEAYLLSSAGGFSGTTQFEGFTILVASGTITGTVRTYGLKN